MPMIAAIKFDSPWLGLAALAIALGCMALAAVRHKGMGDLPAWLGWVGIILLAIAATRPIWESAAQKKVAVLVDCSPSTRGASFRDPISLSRQISELLGHAPYEIYGFADDKPVSLKNGLNEIAVDRTQWCPIDSDAVVLFSDCQFELPKSAQPVYVVADRALERVTDASVQRLQIDGKTLAATTLNTGRARLAKFQGVDAEAADTVSTDVGRQMITRTLADGAAWASMQLDQGDLWPENDSLSIRNSYAFASEWWWIGDAQVPDDNTQWRRFAPGQLPHDTAQYLAPSVIVLNNVAASELSVAEQDHLAQYTRDLGGSLLILGGDHAFAAGGYVGSVLETLSPLASTPPEPTTRWILLIDSSGSMAQTAGPGRQATRWELATSAAVRLLPLLPAKDPVQIGQFSNLLRWWSNGATAAETVPLQLPPSDAVPFGPTDLEAALDQIAGDTPDTVPTQLLVLSDCDAQISQPDQLAQIMHHKKIQLNVLALGEGSGLNVARQIAEATGGKVILQANPDAWVTTVQQMGQAGIPQSLNQVPVSVRFTNEASKLGIATASTWNQTWPRDEAHLIAESTPNQPATPMGASWQAGRGRAAATAWTLEPKQIDTLAQLLALRPRDPRFAMQWDIGPTLSVTVNASEDGRYMNDLKLQLEITDNGSMQMLEIPQTAPGQYAVSMPAPRGQVIASVLNDRTVVDRVAVAGRYAPEFDALGNDHDAMEKLAQLSGGEVIWPSDHRQIDFHWPTRQHSLAGFIGMLGAALMGAGLVMWRLKGVMSPMPAGAASGGRSPPVR